jgi:hypothetical protein
VRRKRNNKRKKLEIEKCYKKDPAGFRHVFSLTSSAPRQPDNGSQMSKMLLTRLKTRISAHCNEPTQYWWIFAIANKVVVLHISTANVVDFWN